MTGEITLNWRGGAETVFCVAQVRSILALEDACGAGIFEIAERLESVARASAEERIGGRAKLNDIRETIRLGLIGGGKSSDEAAKLVRLHVDGYPTLEGVLVAYNIIAAVLRGVPGDDVGKKDQADRAEGRASGSTVNPDGSSGPLATASEPA